MDGGAGHERENKRANALGLTAPGLSCAGGAKEGSSGVPGGASPLGC
jgi:hypothetical protein